MWTDVAGGQPQASLSRSARGLDQLRRGVEPGDRKHQRLWDSTRPPPEAAHQAGAIAPRKPESPKATSDGVLFIAVAHSNDHSVLSTAFHDGSQEQLDVTRLHSKKIRTRSSLHLPVSPPPTENRSLSMFSVLSLVGLLSAFGHPSQSLLPFFAGFLLL